MAAMCTHLNNSNVWFDLIGLFEMFPANENFQEQARLEAEELERQKLIPPPIKVCIMNAHSLGRILSYTGAPEWSDSLPEGLPER